MQYLDALEVAQVTADDFLFAKPAMVTAKALAIVPQSGLQLAESTLAMQPASLAERPSTTPAPLPNVANLVEAMAAFLPQPGVPHWLPRRLYNPGSRRSPLQSEHACQAGP